ncbi:MAG: winged helix-turn-helix domain-containing protein [Candidatus Azobacteroides sp.]|nr:winged helix-turn-helix domain-containing protein [Candidatus Azobacteroides sp.]
MDKNDIGTNAGVIWHLLADNGALNIREIGEHTHWREACIFLALGWLARENKINFLEKDDAMYIELNDSHFSEIYY